MNLWSERESDSPEATLPGHSTAVAQDAALILSVLASVTKYHKLGAHTRELTPHSSAGGKSEIRTARELGGSLSCVADGHFLMSSRGSEQGEASPLVTQGGR